MKKNRLISVIMPVYNAQKFLHDSIGSILAQTYQNWELIAVDDGSKDKSFEILTSFAQRDRRIKIFKNTQNQGIGKTVNIALSKIKGSYIARQDADDISLSTRLEKQLFYLINNPSIAIVGSFMNEINLLNETVAKRIVPITHEEIKKAMFTTQAIQNPTVMINRKKIPKNELWFNGKISPVDELDFFFRLLNKVKFANIPEFLVTYRRHGSNSSLKNIKKTFFLTFITRLKALFVYGYRPGIKEFFIHWMQSIVVFTMPNSLLYAIFQLWKEHSSLPSLIPIRNPLPQLFIGFNQYLRRIYKTVTAIS